MSFIDIAYAIAELGILIIIAGIFLYDKKKTKSSYDDKFDQLFKYVMEQKKISKTIEIENKKEDIATVYEDKLDEYLLNLMYGVDAGRAFFVRFHNGTYDFAGISMLKMSMTNEVTRNGVEPTIETFINQFRNMFKWALDDFAKDGFHYCKDTEIYKDINENAYTFLCNRGVKRSYLLPIIHKNRQIGFIGIEYLKNNIEFNEESMFKKTQETKVMIETALDIAALSLDA